MKSINQKTAERLESRIASLQKQTDKLISTLERLAADVAEYRERFVEIGDVANKIIPVDSVYMSGRVKRIIEKLNIRTVNELFLLSEQELHNMHGVGRGTIREIRRIKGRVV